MLKKRFRRRISAIGVGPIVIRPLWFATSSTKTNLIRICIPRGYLIAPLPGAMPGARAVHVTAGVCRMLERAPRTRGAKAFRGVTYTLPGLSTPAETGIRIGAPEEETLNALPAANTAVAPDTPTLTSTNSYGLQKPSNSPSKMPPDEAATSALN